MKQKREAYINFGTVCHARAVRNRRKSERDHRSFLPGNIVEANQSVYTESFYPSAACATPQYLLHMLFETSAPAWIKEDGQLQEEQIRAFFEDAGRIYAAGKRKYTDLFSGERL